MNSAVSRRQALGLGGLGGTAALVFGSAGVANAGSGATTTPADLPDITDAAPVPEQVGGSAGLARGQVARLSFHIRDILGASPPDPCDVAIRIRDFTGNVLAERIVTDVPANHGAFVDYVHPASTPTLLARATAGALATRIQLVGEIEHTSGYTVGGTLEIIDGATGNTVMGIVPCVIPAPEAVTTVGPS